MGVDGAYYLCKEKKFWPYPNPGGDRCLVYSFGIGWDFKFDDAIAKTGCEVHSFDPCKYICFKSNKHNVMLNQMSKLIKKKFKANFFNLMLSLKIYQQ